MRLLANAASVCTALSSAACAVAALSLHFKDLASPTHNSIRALAVEEECARLPCAFWLDNQGGITQHQGEEVQGQKATHFCSWRAVDNDSWRAAGSEEVLSRATCWKMRLARVGTMTGPHVVFGVVDTKHACRADKSAIGAFIHGVGDDRQYRLGDEFIILFCPRQRELRIHHQRAHGTYPVPENGTCGNTFVTRNLPPGDYQCVISLCCLAMVTVSRATPTEHALCYDSPEREKEYRLAGHLRGGNSGLLANFPTA